MSAQLKAHFPIELSGYSAGKGKVSIGFTIPKSALSDERAREFFVQRRLTVTLTNKRLSVDANGVPKKQLRFADLSDDEEELTVEAVADTSQIAMKEKAWGGRLTFQAGDVDTHTLEDLRYSEGSLIIGSVSVIEDAPKEERPPRQPQTIPGLPKVYDEPLLNLTDSKGAVLEKRSAEQLTKELGLDTIGDLVSFLKRTRKPLPVLSEIQYITAPRAKRIIAAIATLVATVSPDEPEELGTWPRDKCKSIVGAKKGKCECSMLLYDDGGKWRHGVEIIFDGDRHGFLPAKIGPKRSEETARKRAVTDLISELSRLLKNNKGNADIETCLANARKLKK